MILISQIITVGILATIFMTVFSYGFSYVVNGNFKEPQLLNYLIDKLPKNKYSICREHIYGWLIHISTGILFVLVFKIVTIFIIVDLSFWNGFLSGLLAGLIGVGMWSVVFTLHPNPPSNNKPMFYLQLICAHIIFGIVMVYSLRLF